MISSYRSVIKLYQIPTNIIKWKKHITQYFHELPPSLSGCAESTTNPPFYMFIKICKWGVYRQSSIVYHSFICLFTLIEGNLLSSASYVYSMIECKWKIESWIFWTTWVYFKLIQLVLRDKYQQFVTLGEGGGRVGIKNDLEKLSMKDDNFPPLRRIDTPVRENSKPERLWFIVPCVSWQ